MTIQQVLCPHQFFEVKKIIKPYPCDNGCNDLGPHIHANGEKNGSQVMCALCAEQRKLWDDGSMEIIKKED